MRRIRPSATRTARVSYTDWSEIVPISVLTASATLSAVAWGWAVTARSTARRCAVIWIPRRRRRSAGSFATPNSVDQLFDSFKCLTTPSVAPHSTAGLSVRDCAAAPLTEVRLTPVYDEGHTSRRGVARCWLLYDSS